MSQNDSVWSVCAAVLRTLRSRAERTMTTGPLVRGEVNFRSDFSLFKLKQSLIPAGVYVSNELRLKETLECGDCLCVSIF